MISDDLALLSGSILYLFFFWLMPLFYVKDGLPGVLKAHVAAAVFLVLLMCAAIVVSYLHQTGVVN